MRRLDLCKLPGGKRSDALGHGEIGDNAEMIARPDSIDWFVEDSCASRNVHGLPTVCAKTHEDVVDSPERPVAEWAHVLDHFIFNDRARGGKGMSGIVRMRALPRIVVAYAEVAQGLAAGPKTYVGRFWIGVEISGQDHLSRGSLDLFLEESSCDYSLEFSFSLKVQLPMGKMVDEQERPGGVWCLHFHNQSSSGESRATRRHVQIQFVDFAERPATRDGNAHSLWIPVFLMNNMKLGSENIADLVVLVLLNRFLKRCNVGLHGAQPLDEKTVAVWPRPVLLPEIESKHAHRSTIIPNRRKRFSRHG